MGCRGPVALDHVRTDAGSLRPSIADAAVPEG